MILSYITFFKILKISLLSFLLFFTGYGLYILSISFNLNLVETPTIPSDKVIEPVIIQNIIYYNPFLNLLNITYLYLKGNIKLIFIIFLVVFVVVFSIYRIIKHSKLLLTSINSKVPLEGYNSEVTQFIKKNGVNIIIYIVSIVGVIYLVYVFYNKLKTNYFNFIFISKICNYFNICLLNMNRFNIIINLFVTKNIDKLFNPYTYNLYDKSIDLSFSDYIYISNKPYEEPYDHSQDIIMYQDTGVELTHDSNYLWNLTDDKPITHCIVQIPVISKESLNLDNKSPSTTNLLNISSPSESKKIRIIDELHTSIKSSECHYVRSVKQNVLNQIYCIYTSPLFKDFKISDETLIKITEIICKYINSRNMDL